jgi:thiamine pyrophosphate-dependent acetolactate synthase large subunit-like protein
MDAVILKRGISALIESISDIEVLQALKTLLSHKVTKEADWWNTISEEERNEIKQGLEELNGEVIPHDEILKKYKKWLV